MKNTLDKVKINSSLYILMMLAMIAGYIKHVLIIMCIIVIHELGHVFFITLFDIEVEKIEIYPFGGLTSINKRIHERIYKDVLISLGGIIFQLLLFLVFGFAYKMGWIVTSTYNLFLKSNCSVLFFNLLPIIPLDGSKLLQAVLAKVMAFRKSYVVMIVVSVISLIGFMIFNFVYKLNDIVIYMFLLFKLVEMIGEYKYVVNKFYLERIMYSHYYNEIISDEDDIKNLKLDKYYYFYDNGRYVNEKDYVKKKYFC